MANIQVARANVNKPRDSNGHGREFEVQRATTCEVTGRRKQRNRSEVPCSKAAADQELEGLLQNQVPTSIFFVKFIKLAFLKSLTFSTKDFYR